MFLGIRLKLQGGGGTYALVRHISALGLIDLPVPEKILLMLAQSRKNIADGAIYNADSLIADLQFDDGGGPYLKFDEIIEDGIRGLIPISKLAAIKVCREIGISSARRILEFNEVVLTCLTPRSPGAILDPYAVNYARTVLHRLSKGRGVGLAEIDGMPIAADIVEDVVPEAFFSGLIASADLQELCQWTGTFASVFRSGEGRTKRTMVRPEQVIEMTEKCLQKIEGSGDTQSLTPRAFSSICKAIKNIKPSAKSKKFSERLLRSVDFKQTLENDFNRNLAVDPSFENMSRRISTTVSLFVTLLRRAGRDREAFDLLANWKEQLPANDYEFKLESQCRLQRLSLAKKLKLTEIDMESEFSSILEDVQDRQGSSVVKIRELMTIISHRHGQPDEAPDLSNEFDILYDLTCAALDELPNQLLCQVVEQFILQHFVETNTDDSVLIKELSAFCRTSDSRAILFDNYVSILTVLAGLAKYPYADRLTTIRSNHALRLSIELLKTSSRYVEAAKMSLIDARDIQHLFWGTSALFQKDKRLVVEFEAAIRETMNQLNRGDAA